VSPRSVALTFDNLGEAAEDEGRPPGGHPSATVALPAILDALDRLSLAATFCVEGINARAYPDAVRGIAARGHEVALHAWEHERWDSLEPEREAELIRRGRDAFAELGVAVTGFRPPGGGLTERTLPLLHAAGFEWCSPAGERPRLDPSGVAIVPFRWPLVDATYLHAPLADTLLSPAEAGERLWAELQADQADPAVLVLHPFLAVDSEARAALVELLERLARLRDAGKIRVVPIAEAKMYIRDSAEEGS
jgi:peptidoglycan/xylan/chitin deacetylase (PgdA/CDA1 family)